MSNNNELIECEYREGITLSDKEFYERCEIENEEGEITVYLKPCWSLTV